MKRVDKELLYYRLISDINERYHSRPDTPPTKPNRCDPSSQWRHSARVASRCHHTYQHAWGIPYAAYRNKYAELAVALCQYHHFVSLQTCIVGVSNQTLTWVRKRATAHTALTCQ